MGFTTSLNTCLPVSLTAAFAAVFPTTLALAVTALPAPGAVSTLSALLPKLLPALAAAFFTSPPSIAVRPTSKPPATAFDTIEPTAATWLRTGIFSAAIAPKVVEPIFSKIDSPFITPVTTRRNLPPFSVRGSGWFQRPSTISRTAAGSRQGKGRTGGSMSTSPSAGRSARRSTAGGATGGGLSVRSTRSRNRRRSLRPIRPSSEERQALLLCPRSALSSNPNSTGSPSSTSAASVCARGRCGSSAMRRSLSRSNSRPSKKSSAWRSIVRTARRSSGRSRMWPASASASAARGIASSCGRPVMHSHSSGWLAR